LVNIKHLRAVGMHGAGGALVPPIIFINVILKKAVYRKDVGEQSTTSHLQKYFLEIHPNGFQKGTCIFKIKNNKKRKSN